MKGIRFYLEYESPAHKRKGEHLGTVFARYISSPLESVGMAEGAGAVSNIPNDWCCGSTASLDYLRTNCKRIPEAKAKEIHPRLIDYLTY